MSPTYTIHDQSDCSICGIQRVVNPCLCMKEYMEWQQTVLLAILGRGSHSVAISAISLTRGALQGTELLRCHEQIRLQLQQSALPVLRGCTPSDIWWALRIQMYKHSHTPHTHTPVSSLLIILSPKAAIFGLPLTAFIMAQTDLKASKVHFSFKHLWRTWFCSVGSSALVMVRWSPLLIISLWRSSSITFSASISFINWSRNWSRISSAARRWRNHGTCTQLPTPCHHSIWDHALSNTLLMNGDSPFNLETITE